MIDSASALPRLAARRDAAQPIAWIAFLSVLALGVPQFLKMPLTNDPVYFDLQADLLRHGGVLYRDMVEPNFPGVVWLHALVRPVVGKSSEALRAVDLLILSTSIGVLCWSLRRSGSTATSTIWWAAGLFLFYLSLAEWSHCQRDVWLLLPASVAFALRLRHALRPSGEEFSVAALLGRGGLEGFIWGAAMWLKPHVIVPCVMVWLASAVVLRRVRPLAWDGAGMLIGGSVAGGLGLGWLVATGTWPHFWDNLVHWNPEYAAVGRQNWTYPTFFAMCFRFLPWGLLHLLAIPVAIAWLGQAIQRCIRPVAADERPASQDATAAKTLWSALYLAWMFQALVLQILFDYVHVPGIILSALVVALWVDLTLRGTPAWIGAIVFGACACWASPLPNLDRLALWSSCVFEASTPELRNQLRQIREPDWVELEKVAEYLGARDLHDGDLICYGNHLVHLYPRLGIRPTNRFVYQAWYLTKMPSRRDAIRQDLVQHPPRFIVSDLNSILGRPDFSPMPGADGTHSLPEGIPAKFLQGYPLRYPLVFRADGLVVLRYESAGASEDETGKLGTGR